MTGPRAPANAFTRTQLDDLAAARLLALERMPYLATALFEVIPIASPGIATFGVDASWRLYIDPQQLTDWGPRQAAGVLLHEVGHLLRDHHARYAEQAIDQPRLWNLAGDAEINDDLIAAGVPLPGDPITPTLLGRPDGQLAEHYFHHLLTELHELEAACGSGAGGEPLPGELGEDEAPARSALDRDLTRRKVAQDIEQAGVGSDTGAGAIPGGWRRWAAEVLQPPMVPWQQLLRRTIRRSLAVRAGQLDSSYRRPGRRRIPDVLTPGLTRPVLRVGVVLDTSSSMAHGQLRAALAELDAICRRAGIGTDELTVITADVAVHEVPRLRRAADLPILGGGGTDLRPALAHLAAHRRRPHVVVVLTDGFTPWPRQPPPRCTVVVVLIARADGRTPPEPPDWSDTIRIEPAA